jgi:phage gp36-like protein
LSSARRKMLAAQEDIANLIADLAKRKDMTVYQTVNDILEQLLYRIVDKSYEEDKEKSTEIWREMGHWYGKYFKAKHENPLEAFREAMELFCVGDAEYSLEQNSRDITLSFIGEKLTPGYTELFSVLLEELMKVLGYKLKDRELRKGMVKLQLTR